MLEMLKSRKEQLQAQGKKGFTLMEMLIVIAIIAILIAIAIPVFTSQLERANESTDVANLRSAYASAAAEVLVAKDADGKVYPGVSAGPVNLQQTGDWEHFSTETIGGVAVSSIPKTGPLYVNVAKDGSVTITGSATSGYETIPATGKQGS